MAASRNHTTSVTNGGLSTQAADFFMQTYGPARAGCLNDLRRAGCSEEEAEEIFSATFEHVMRTVDPIGRSFAVPQMVNLLKTACRRRLIDERRHEGVLRRVPLTEVSSIADVEADTPDELAELHEEIAIGREAVSTLPDRDRQVFFHRHRDGLDPDEILQKMPGLSRRSYRKILQRANARVLQAFEEIDSGARCREMEREHLRRYVSSEATESELAAVEAHLQHCRACQHTVVEMRGYLHDVGSSLAAMIAGTATAGGHAHSSWIAEGLARVADAGESLAEGTRVLRERLREQSIRAATSMPGSGGDAAAGQFIGASTVKVAAGCVATATATTAACVALGVSPLAVVGVSQDPAPPRHVKRAAAEERPKPRLVPPPAAAAASESEIPGDEQSKAAAPPTSPVPEKAQQAQEKAEKEQAEKEQARRSARKQESPVGETDPTAGLEGAGTPARESSPPSAEEASSEPSEATQSSVGEGSEAAQSGSSSIGGTGSSGETGGGRPASGGSELGL